MTDVSQKDDIYGVAENIVKDLDVDNEIEVVNTKSEEDNDSQQEVDSEEEQVQPVEPATAELENYSFEEETPEVEEADVVETAPKRKAGRPRKVDVAPAEPKVPGKRGRPRKETTETSATAAPKNSVGRPKKLVITPVVASPTAARKAGRPKKIVKDVVSEEPKRGRGRPKKQSIDDINKKLTEEEARLAKMRQSMNQELEAAMNGTVDNSQLKRQQLMTEIDKLQAEAQRAISSNDANADIEGINAKLEDLLSQIKKLNS